MCQLAQLIPIQDSKPLCKAAEHKADILDKTSALLRELYKTRKLPSNNDDILKGGN